MFGPVVVWLADLELESIVQHSSSANERVHMDAPQEWSAAAGSALPKDKKLVFEQTVAIVGRIAVLWRWQNAPVKTVME